MAADGVSSPIASVAAPMNAADAAWLSALPQWAFAAVLLMARIGSATMLLPGIGEAELPATVRLGFAWAVTITMLPVLAPAMPAAPDLAWPAIRLIAGESVTGVWLGLLSRLWMLSLPLAGQMIAAASGLANVVQPDPMLGPQTSVLARALGLAAPVAILASGLHRFVFMSVADSYTVIGAGGTLPMGDITTVIVRTMAESFALAVGLAAPFLVAGMIWHVMLALAARLVPQLQIYFAAMPGQILGGIALFSILAGALIESWDARLRVSFAALIGG